MPNDFTTGPVETAADLEAVIGLFVSYSESLPVDLSYQGFADEVAALPGRYATPAGALLLARSRSGTAIGCVGLRPLAPAGHCEIKRLYVVPEGRALGAGRALARSIVEAARSKRYRRVFLDTLPSMSAAMHLYSDLGFAPVAPYYSPTPPGTVFMAMDLPNEPSRLDTARRD